jgi:thiosulfate/3-mercaptopyruvate sulfurtransferase
MLDVLGERAAVLDGGIAAWEGPLEPGVVERPSGRFTVRPWPADLVVDADGVAAAAPDVTVLDARSADRYRQGADIDPRPGHVPGATSAPATDNLVDGRWRTGPELADHYRGLHATGAVIAYCGSGVTACADLLGRRLAGLPDGRLYPGSWSQWGADPSRPATEGDRP